MSDYYQLPDYIEDWIDIAFRTLPKGWDIVVIPERACLQVLDLHKDVRYTYGYFAISEGFPLPEWEQS